MGLMRLIGRMMGRRLDVRTERLAELTPAQREHRLMEQTIALASHADNHPLWVTMLQLVDEHEQNMKDRVLEEKLTSEERHYNAGLAAGAQYLANALRDAKARANLVAQKRRKEE